MSQMTTKNCEYYMYVVLKLVKIHDNGFCHAPLSIYGIPKFPIEQQNLT